MPGLRHQAMLRHKNIAIMHKQRHEGIAGETPPPVATGFGATRIAIPIGIGLAFLLMVLR